MKKMNKRKEFKIGENNIDFTRIDERGRFIITLTNNVKGFKMYLRLTKTQLYEIGKILVNDSVINGNLKHNSFVVNTKVREYYKSGNEIEMSYKYNDGPMKLSIVTFAGQIILSISGICNEGYERTFFSTSFTGYHYLETISQMEKCINEMHFNNW